MKRLSRRDFLKSVGLGTAGLTVFEGLRANPAEAIFKANIQPRPYKLQFSQETPTICCYCGCGCGLLIHTAGEGADKKVIFSEGDPDHPINLGAACPKGQAISDVAHVIEGTLHSFKDNERVPNKLRLTKVLYRAPYSEAYEEVEWDWALAEIAKRVKATRDGSFEKTDAKGVTVNRTQAIGHLGSASLDSEENYLLHKMMRAIGVVNIDHHARL
jgi:formate dehydrogenase major subunit